MGAVERSETEGLQFSENDNPSVKNFVFATSPVEGRQVGLQKTNLAPLTGELAAVRLTEG